MGGGLKSGFSLPMGGNDRKKTVPTLRAPLSGTFPLKEGCRKPVLGVWTVPSFRAPLSGTFLLKSNAKRSRKLRTIGGCNETLNLLC